MNVNIRIKMALSLILGLLLPCVNSVSAPQAKAAPKESAAGAVSGGTTVKKINYKGWDGAWELSNGTSRLVVVPSIGGRIMEYSIDGRNIIWQNSELVGTIVEDPPDWPNYGGYKNWNAPQDFWGWPPDPNLDWEPASIEILSGNGIRVTGQTSSKYGLHFVRDIYLDPNSSVITLKQQMVSSKAQTRKWSLWDITQVITPGMAAMPVSPASSFKDGVRVISGENAKVRRDYADIKDGIAVITHAKGRDLKFGADSPEGWIAYTSGNLIYIKRFRSPKAGEIYPDQGLNNEVYLSGSMGYVEIEVLGPTVSLKKGQSTAFDEEWELISLDKPVSNPEDFRKVLREHSSLLHSYLNPR